MPVYLEGYYNLQFFSPFQCFIISLSYSADEWNLKRPLKECSLRVERRGDALLLLFTYLDEGKKGESTLFALTCIDLLNGNQDMNHHVLTVGDSSRYFVVRVSSENGDREALLGLGFRDRDEAADFRAAISHYVNAVIKEKMRRNAGEEAQPLAVGGDSEGQ